LTPSLGTLIATDLRQKALWCYDSGRWPALLKVLVTDGTAAMVLYRLMQWSRRWRLKPMEMFFNKINAVCCRCIIGRGAEFGPGFVLIHSDGVVINGATRGGQNVFLEHQVTIGAERRESPVIGDNVFIGAGAKVIGPVRIGNGARVGANAVVIEDVPDRATVVGIPARVVRVRPEPICDGLTAAADTGNGMYRPAPINGPPIHGNDAPSGIAGETGGTGKPGRSSSDTL
jgi:serine O-acetyltransferase